MNQVSLNGKILRHYRLYVLNGKILHQTSYVKPMQGMYMYMYVYAYLFIKGKFYAMGYFVA